MKYHRDRTESLAIAETLKGLFSVRLSWWRDSLNSRQVHESA